MISLIVYILFIFFSYKVILDHYVIINENGNEEASLEVILLWIGIWITFAGIYCIGMGIF